MAKKGNDGRLLVEVMANARPGHDDTTASPDDDLLAEIDQLRHELETARFNAVKAEAERDTALATAAAKVEAAERIIAELRAMQAEARRSWWQRWLGR